MLKRPHHPSPAPAPAPARQRGAFSIIAAASILLLLVCMVLTLDSGRLYLEKRRLQKLADTAALESVARLPDGHCANAPDQALQFARENLLRNDFLADASQQLTLTCVTVTSVDGIRQGTAASDGSAVQIQVSSRLASSLIMRSANLLGADTSTELTLQATAIARRPTPTASFTVGAQLARLQHDGLLVPLLATVGVDIEGLSLLDADGLANASVSTSGLLQQLGVNANIHELRAMTANELIAVSNAEVGPLSLNQLLAAVIPLVSDSQVSVGLGQLQAELGSALDAASMPLLGGLGDQALIALNEDNGQPLDAAVDAQVHVADLIGVALMSAMQGRGLSVPNLQLATLADVELGIVEPPAIGIGPVGTTAYGGQIRLYMDIDTDQLADGALDWLTQDLLGTRVHLPVWIDLVTAQGTLDAISCSAPSPSADIRVESSVLNACVGSMPDELKWSTAARCDSNIGEEQLVTLLGQPILSGKAHLPGLSSDDLLLGMTPGETRSTQINPLNIGNTLEDLTNGLLDLAGGLFRAPQTSFGDDTSYNGSGEQQRISELASQYLDATSQNGFYNVDSVIDLILNGSSAVDGNGNQLLPALVDDDWTVVDSIPTSCVLVLCPSSSWGDGTFSEAFQAYSEPGSLLDLLGVSTLDNGYRNCGGLLSSLLGWNSCIQHNLNRFLQTKPGGLDLTRVADNDVLSGTGSDAVSCAGLLCTLLRPVLELLKPGLNGVGDLLSNSLDDLAGIELGRTDVTLDSVSCGQTELVR